MNYILQFQINIFSFLTLIIICVLVNNRITLGSYSKRMLNALIIVVGIAIVVGPLTWVFDRGQFTGAYLLEYGTNLIMFLLSPIAAGLMISYVGYYVEKDIKKIKHRLFYQHLTILTVVLLILNFFFSFYFSVEKGTNIFSAGTYAWLHYVMVTMMYAYMVYIIIKQRKKVSKGVTNMFMIFFLLPLLGILIQVLDSRLLFTWNSLVLGILVLYVYVESSNHE